MHTCTGGAPHVAIDRYNWLIEISCLRPALLQFYLDTQPPRMLVLNTGVWSLGNRYIAAAREALYWLPRMGADFT